MTPCGPQSLDRHTHTLSQNGPGSELGMTDLKERLRADPACAQDPAPTGPLGAAVSAGAQSTLPHPVGWEALLGRVPPPGFKVLCVELMPS